MSQLEKYFEASSESQEDSWSVVENHQETTDEIPNFDVVGTTREQETTARLMAKLQVEKAAAQFQLDQTRAELAEMREELQCLRQRERNRMASLALMKAVSNQVAQQPMEPKKLTSATKTANLRHSTPNTAGDIPSTAQKEHAQHIATIRSLLAERHENVRLRSQLEAQTIKLQDTQSKLEDIREERDVLTLSQKAQYGHFDDEMIRMNSLLLESNEEKAQLKDTVEQLFTALTYSEMLCDKLERNLETQRSEATRRNKKMRNRRTMNRKYDKAIKRRNAEIETLKEKLDITEGLLYNAQNRREYLEECICKRKKKIGELHGLVLRHKTSLHDARQDLKLLRTSHNALHDDHAKLNVGLETSVAEVNDCISIIGDLAHRNATLKGKMNEQKLQHVRKRKELLKHLFELRGILLQRSYGGGQEPLERPILSEDVRCNWEYMYQPLDGSDDSSDDNDILALQNNDTTKSIRPRPVAKIEFFDDPVKIPYIRLVNQTDKK